MVFFVVEYDKFPLELHNQVFSIVEELFDLPTETKMKNRYEKPLKGYVGQNPMIPLHESMAIHNPTTPEETQFFTNLMWPQGNDRFWYISFRYKIWNIFLTSTFEVVNFFSVTDFVEKKI